MSFLKSKPGQTTLDNTEGLIPNIKTQDELNIRERDNVLKGIQWAEKQKNPNVLSSEFCLKLHEKMFGEVWEWAGSIRSTDTNLGCDFAFIREKLEELFKNTQCQIQEKSYDWVELAARFHHKLVSIHPFLNGNGRHARYMTDLLLKVNNQDKFTWGSKLAESEFQKLYLKALQDADNKNIKTLMEFVKS